MVDYTNFIHLALYGKNFQIFSQTELPVVTSARWTTLIEGASAAAAATCR